MEAIGHDHLKEVFIPNDILLNSPEPDELEKPSWRVELSVERQSWSGKAEFLLSCISYAVGLGNVWRFPYLCYKNGGGAFLVPYVIMLLSVGIPLFYMETCFGQYSATGPITAWKVSPLFTGIGWSMTAITFSGCIYYNMLIAWTLFYFWQSVTSVSGRLPWTVCNPEWSTGDCMLLRTMSERNRCWRQGGFFSFAHNRSCLLPGNASWQMDDKQFGWGSRQSGDANFSAATGGSSSASATLLAQLFEQAAALNASAGVNASRRLHSFLGSPAAPKTSSDEYFHNFVLSISNGFHNLGLPKWELALCLLVAWVIVALCLVKGVQSAGKAVYFTGLFPYLVLTILLIRGLTLEGSSDGLRYFFVPQWGRLLDPTVWGDAAMQVFFSLSSGWGGVIALSSYNKFHNNALLDTLIVSLSDAGTSVYAGMTVFCVLGYMSHVMSLPIDAVAKDGAGLAFVLYPDIVTSLPVSPLWAALFFAMLLTLGFGTMISHVNTLTTAVCDNWHQQLHRGWRPLIVLTAICGSAFLLGLPCTTKGGMFVLQLLDNYCCTYSVLIVGFFELLVITWIYGSERFLDNVREMNKTGAAHRLFWRVTWQYGSLFVIVAVTAFTFASVKPSKYGLYVFPTGADIAGGVISVLVVLPIPAVAVYKVATCTAGATLSQRIKSLMVPAKDWQREMGRGRQPIVTDLAASEPNNFESLQPLTAHAVAPAVAAVSTDGEGTRFMELLRGSGIKL